MDSDYRASPSPLRACPSFAYRVQRGDRRPLRRVVPCVLADQPDCFGLRARVVPAAWHRAIILPAEGCAYETRVSLKGGRR